MPRKTDLPRVDTVGRDESTEKMKSRRSPAPRANTLREAEQQEGTPPYEEWSKQDLYERAVEAGIEGRARMSKKDLINTLRDY